MEVRKAKPVLKWAGGKGQMLNILEQRMPQTYNKYIEPFFGGGALFFDVMPENAIIADSNPELINLYRVIATNVEELIHSLKSYRYDKDMYYQVRGQDISKLSDVEKAARTIYLNKTGFNGLYRVNKKGQFNVPFGRYKNPKILDEANLRTASNVLQSATIVCGDYIDVLEKYAEAGDFVFLDPPYMPVSEYSDFKRYTKEQFGIDDQKRLATEVELLHKRGCYVMLTNSNHPLIQELYQNYDFEVFDTRRSINSKGNKRLGKDVLVRAYPAQCTKILKPIETPKQNKMFPTTRYMGSKEKMLPYIASAVKDLKYNSVLDLFSGSGCVSYLFKTLGKQVFSNDYMAFSAAFSKATVENNDVILTEKDMYTLINTVPDEVDTFVSDTFKGLYFNDEDNAFIDRIRSNKMLITEPYKQSIIDAALSRACMKRRPRGIFTYTGNRYDDGRRDLKISLKDHFIQAVKDFDNAVFDNHQKNKSLNMDFRNVNVDADLVYIDPPYYSKLSDNEYVRRYHFVEGLARDWKGVEIQPNTKTKKFKNYPTPFKSKNTTYQAFESMFKKYANKITVVSYSSNSLPTKEEMIKMMQSNFDVVKVYEIDYRYSFSTHKNSNRNNKVKEYIFIGCSEENLI